VWAWVHTGNLLPWVVLQLGGLLVVLVLVLACLPRRVGGLALHLGVVVVLYALAKLLEAADHSVFEATDGWVSGHSLKHVLAAGAAWPVMAALGSLVALRHSEAAVMPRVMPSGQNGAHAVGVARRPGA